MIEDNDPKPDLRIRPVEAAHVADLIRIGEETNLSRWTAQNYLDEMKNPSAIMLRLVAEDNSTIGFVVGRTVIGGEAETQLDAEIYNIAIDRERQGNGFGQVLFDEFLRVCSGQQVRNIWLEVRESNQKAITFYGKNGFTQVQTRNNFYTDPREAALLMRLILSEPAA
jgi:[ribosomal protein S18]-alanine N-acetyltransferase